MMPFLPQGQSVNLPFTDQDFLTYTLLTDVLIDPANRASNLTVQFLAFDEAQLAAYFFSNTAIEKIKIDGSGHATLKTATPPTGLPFVTVGLDMNLRDSHYGHAHATVKKLTAPAYVPSFTALILNLGASSALAALPTISDLAGTSGSFQSVISSSGKYVIVIGADKTYPKRARLIVYQGS